MPECVLHVGAESDGYGVKKRHGRAVRAHRLAFCDARNLSIEDIEGFVVMHDCDNRLCVNPDHLKLGTHADNCQDKVSKGRQARGSGIGNSKLKENEVKDIKIALSSGETIASQARKYSVSNMCISRISNGITWRHIYV